MLGQVLRPLLKRPWQSAMIVLVIAVGIGMGSAFYSVGVGLLLRPFPFDPEGRLVDVEQTLQPSGDRLMNSQQNLDELGQQSRTLNGVAVYQTDFGSISVNGQAAFAEGISVDHNFFPLLGVSPALGRGFTADDEQPGAPGTIVLSFIYWQRRFAGDPAVLGKRILLDKQPYIVIGVMPESFYFPFPEMTEEDFWVPLQQSQGARGGNYDKLGIARVKAGATVRQAEAEAALIARNISEIYPQKAFTFRLKNYREEVVEGLRPLLLVLAGIMLCVQIVVCINVASLLLVEALRYRKEVEIRFALGGTRWKIARLFLMRALVLAFTGGIAGAGLAYGIVLLIRRLLPAGFPGAEQVAVNTSLLWITVAVALGTGVLFGIWPAFEATRKLHKISLNQTDHATRQSFATLSMRRSRRSLVVLQLAFSSAFLVVAALLGMSLYSLLNVDLGFRLDHRLLVSAVPTDPVLKDEAALRQFYTHIQEQLAAVPGVDAVTVSSNAPLAAHGARGFRLKEEPAPKDERVWMADAETVSLNYFQVLGMTVRRGRSFAEADSDGGAPVAMVNETFARHFFGSVSPLGKHICIPTGSCQWREIIGIVADAHESRVDGPFEPTFYVPFGQAQPGFLSEAAFIVHTRTAPASVVKPIERTMRELADAPMAPITLEEMRSRQLMGSRYSVWFIAMVAVLALSLAAMGVYGVVAGDVEQRRREIGIRTALGATPRDIAALFQRQMLFMLVPGLLLGLGLAAMLVRYTTSLLFGITPINPLAYGTAALVLTTVAVVATALPVRRALREPTAETLRAE